MSIVPMPVTKLIAYAAIEYGKIGFAMATSIVRMERTSLIASVN